MAPKRNSLHRQPRSSKKQLPPKRCCSPLLLLPFPSSLFHYSVQAEYSQQQAVATSFPPLASFYSLKYSNASSNSSSFEAAPFSGDVHQAAAEDLTDVAVSVANLRVLRNESCANLMRVGYEAS